MENYLLNTGEGIIALIIIVTLLGFLSHTFVLLFWPRDWKYYRDKVLVDYPFVLNYYNGYRVRYPHMPDDIILWHILRDLEEKIDEFRSSRSPEQVKAYLDAIHLLKMAHKRASK